MGGVIQLPRGRKYRQGVVKRVYLDTHPGVAVGNLWTEKELTMQGRDDERTGSPDQKPLALYERIIEAGSNEGDIVLDPFCGCATTIIAASNLKRRWIGIDRRKDARYHIITRLMGIDRKERERLEKYATDREWLDRQMQRYEMHYQTEPPTRTDNQETAAAELPSVFPIDEEFQMTRQGNTPGTYRGRLDPTVGAVISKHLTLAILNLTISTPKMGKMTMGSTI